MLNFQELHERGEQAIARGREGSKRSVIVKLEVEDG